MIHLITGRAGTGKTALMMQKAGQTALDREGQVLFLVPEQFSFETERALYRALGAEAMLRVEVLSFRRLAQSVFRACGGLAGEYLTPEAKAVVMSEVLYDLKESLELFAPQAEDQAFLSTLCQTVTAFKNADVPPERLHEAALEAGGGLLGQKLSELSVLYQGYESAIDGVFADEDDDLARACELARTEDFFAGKTVFFDGFTGFTGLEYRMLSLIFTQCDEIWFSFCLGEKDEPYGLFTPVQETVRRLAAMGKEHRQRFVPALRLEEPHRFLCPELAALERGVFSASRVPFLGENRAVRLVKVKSEEEEALFAAQEVSRLVREEGYRFRDIALLSRNPEKYRMYLEEILNDYEIPFFFDRKMEVRSTPIARFLIALFDCMLRRFQTSDVLMLYKSPLLGFDEVEASAVENYAFIWNIQGLKWREPFSGHPEGLGAPFTEEAKEELKKLEDLRRALVEPVERLSLSLQAGEAQELCARLYEYLRNQGIITAMAHLCGKLEREGQPLLAGEQWESWEAVLSVLQSIASALKGRELTLARFAGLMRAGLSACQLGKIPEHTDEVVLGDVSRTRIGEKRAVFLFGVTEGEFPASAPGGGVFTDRDARQLEEMGLAFAKTGEKVLFDEQLFAYQAMTCARERLYVTLPAAGLTGKELVPSGIVRELLAVFPKGLVLEPQLHTERAAVTRGGALREYFLRAGEKDAFFSTLEALFAEEPSIERMLLRSLSPLSPRLSGRGVTRRLYGDRLFLSPSRVEKFYQCPFSFFLAYGLRLRVPRQAELSPIETGSVIHYCLERLVKRFGARGLSGVPQKTLSEAVGEALTQYLTEQMGGLGDKPARFRYLFARLSRTVLTLIRHLAEEFAQSEFLPSDFELEISPSGEVKPVELTTSSGETVHVVGRVDRVDTCVVDGVTYVRVVDYKTGSTKFALQDVMEGLGLQMLLYLFSIWRGGKGKYGDAAPAGVLYLPAVNPTVKASRDADGREVDKLRRQALRMNGLVLSDPRVIKAMEGEAKGIFIPAALKANGELDARSSVASLAQMGALARHIDREVIQMAEELYQGKIDVSPLEKGGRLPCEYCEYRTVCQVDPERQARQPREVKNVFEAIAAEGEGVSQKNGMS